MVPALQKDVRKDLVAPLLWALLGLFILRVLGQALSGLMPYEVLLPSQIVLIALMAKICLDFTRGRGFFRRRLRA